MQQRSGLSGQRYWLARKAGHTKVLAISCGRPLSRESLTAGSSPGLARRGLAQRGGLIPFGQPGGMAAMLALERGATLWAWFIEPDRADPACLDPLMGRAAIAGAGRKARGSSPNPPRRLAGRRTLGIGFRSAARQELTRSSARPRRPLPSSGRRGRSQSSLGAWSIQSQGRALRFDHIGGGPKQRTGGL
jgi:hypothetical protein